MWFIHVLTNIIPNYTCSETGRDMDQITLVTITNHYTACTGTNPTYLLSSGGRGPSLSLAGLLPAIDEDTGGSLAPAVDAEVELGSTLPLVEVEDSGGLERPSIIRRFITELHNKKDESRLTNTATMRMEMYH